MGCGPYELTEFNPGDSATFTRWEDFWGDYEYYSPPQHEILELVKVPEATTRFAPVDCWQRGHGPRSALPHRQGHGTL